MLGRGSSASPLPRLCQQLLAQCPLSGSVNSTITTGFGASRWGRGCRPVPSQWALGSGCLCKGRCKAGIQFPVVPHMPAQLLLTRGSFPQRVLPLLKVGAPTAHHSGSPSAAALGKVSGVVPLLWVGAADHQRSPGPSHKIWASAGRERSQGVMNEDRGEHLDVQPEFGGRETLITLVPGEGWET